MIQYAQELLSKYNIDPNILQRYNEPHRHYHNMEHIVDLLSKADKNGFLPDDLGLAIIFHDIIYDPKSLNNEEKSADLFNEIYYGPNSDKIIEAILDTKKHSPTRGNPISYELCSLDLSILKSDPETLIDFENKIFKEYQFLDWDFYKTKRLEVLTKLSADPILINYVKTRKPKIAFFPGSFNPFHRGHHNVLKRAEQIFDKVIIGRGINPDKQNELKPLDPILDYYQVIEYSGLMIKAIKELNYDVTIIRGIRNHADFDYELKTYQYCKYQNGGSVNFITMYTEPELSHISSSDIRYLQAKGEDVSDLLPEKVSKL